MTSNRTCRENPVHLRFLVSRKDVLQQASHSIITSVTLKSFFTMIWSLNSKACPAPPGCDTRGGPVRQSWEIGLGVHYDGV